MCKITFHDDAAKCNLIGSHLSTSYNLVKLSSFLGKFRTGLIIISDWTSHHNACPAGQKAERNYSSQPVGGIVSLTYCSVVIILRDIQTCLTTTATSWLFFCFQMMSLDVKTKTITDNGYDGYVRHKLTNYRLLIDFISHWAFL